MPEEYEAFKDGRVEGEHLQLRTGIYIYSPTYDLLMTFACAAQGDRLRAAGRIITNGHTGAARAIGRGGKGDADRTGSPGRQRARAEGTGVGLGKVPRVGAGQANRIDGQVGCATIFESDVLG